MHTSTAFLLTNLFSTALAFPQQRRQAPQAPPLSSSSQLRFLIHATNPSNDLTPTLTGQSLRQGPDAEPNYFDAMVATSAGLDGSFYPNGTAEQIASGQTSIGGYAAVYPTYYPAVNLYKSSQMGPNGVTVASVARNLTGVAKPIWMTPPTLGVVVSVSEADGIARLTVPQGRQFYVCRKTRIAHSAEFTLYLVYTKAAEGEATPTDCADVEIIPQCTSFEFNPENVYAGGQYAFEAPCYADASVVWDQSV